MIEIIPNWHPMLVHFTVALWSVSVGLFFVGRLFQGTDLGENCKTVALYNLWLGALLSIFTGLAGWDAYNTVDHDEISHAAMTNHRNWALVTLVVFFGLALWTAFSAKIREKASLPFLGVALVALALLMTTGYKGAEVVYRYGLGVMSLPKSEGKGHDHSHAGGGHGHGESASADDMQIPDDMQMDQMDMSQPDGGDAASTDAHNDGHDH